MIGIRILTIKKVLTLFRGLKPKVFINDINKVKVEIVQTE